MRGPYLVRTAEMSNDEPSASDRNRTLRLTGDTEKATPIEVFAPPKVTRLVWNGHRIETTRTGSGSLRATLRGPKPVTLPRLTHWTYRAGAPEIRPGFDDSGWQRADRKHTNNPFWDGKLPILNGDAYGFHHGDVWYRGHFTASGHEKGIVLTAKTGTHGVFSAWLNGHYLGSSPGGARYFNVDPSDLQAGRENVVSVLVENMGHTMATHKKGYKMRRGLIDASFIGSSAAIAWRLQGNRDGETPIDAVRGPFNNGGLYGERMGWSLPGFPDRHWQNVSLPNHVSKPGVGWYRTTFKLHVPVHQDAPIGLKISDKAFRHYRALIFINGWQFGRYINRLGPQHVFALPPGIVHPHGKNTIAIASWGTEHYGGLGKVSLVQLGNYRSALRVRPVSAPGYDRKKYRK